MISEQLQKEMDSARRFGQQLEGLVFRREGCPAGDRDVLLIAYWSIVFDCHKAILTLLPAGLLAAAFALVRPVVEVMIRAHVVLICSPEDLLKIQQDEYRVNFTDVGPQIDKAFGLGSFMVDFLKGASKTLHSYTHGGILQVGRRFDGSDLKPRYTDGEITEVIHTTTSAIFMATNLVTKHFGFEEEWRRTTEMFFECGKPS